MKKGTSLLIAFVIASPINFSEIMPNPDGKDKNHEWIELQNTGDTDINLENWQISNNKTHTIKGGIIPPSNQFIIDNLKITLRNKEDHIKLLNPQGKIVEEVSYQNAPNGLSLSKISESWQWASPSKNNNNGKLKQTKLSISEFLDRYFFSQNQKILLESISNDNRQILTSTIEKQGESTLLDFKIQNPNNLEQASPNEDWLIYNLAITILLATTAYLLLPLTYK